MRTSWIAVALGLVLAAACGETGVFMTPKPVCTPGVQVTCACPGGREGAQACSADGSAWGACEGCPAGTGGAGSSSSTTGAGSAPGVGGSGGAGSGGADGGVQVDDGGTCVAVGQPCDATNHQNSCCVDVDAGVASFCSGQGTCVGGQLAPDDAGGFCWPACFYAFNYGGNACEGQASDKLAAIKACACSDGGGCAAACGAVCAGQGDAPVAACYGCVFSTLDQSCKSKMLACD